MPKIPFGWLPGHWGLRGETRDIAKIEYEIDDPYECEVAKAHVRYNGDQLTSVLLEIDLRYEKIDQHDYDMHYIDTIKDDIERQYKTLDLLLKKGDITEVEYDKEVHNIEGAPWVHIEANYSNGELEVDVDWNASYIEFLKASGYGNTSSTDEEIIDEYMRDFGRKLSADDEDADDYARELGYGFVKEDDNGDGTKTYS